MTSREVGEPLGGARGPAAPESAAGRIAGYIAERFRPRGLIVHALGYAAAVLFGKALVGDGALQVGAEDVLGVLGLIAYLLLARVYDEHKDYEFDVVHLPDRPLPRGSISWREVDALGVVAAIVQLAVCLAIDGGIGPVVLWWAIAFTYLGITRYEFFIRPWLRRHFVTNTVLHLPVYALGLVWAAQIGAEPESIPAAVFWLGAYVYFHTFGLDLWRKSHAPEDERPAVDSYTQRWGTTGASVATGAIVLVAAALAGVMLSVADAGVAAAYVALAVVPIPLLLRVVAYARTPNRETNAARRTTLALTLLALHAVVILTLAIDRGLS